MAGHVHSGWEMHHGASVSLASPTHIPPTSGWVWIKGGQLKSTPY